ncbi:MAG: hypothetical protein FH748_16665 [Balneolaceae bacterium]|nr:hypothetical protein [Balneolaceae bacterium]
MHELLRKLNYEIEIHPTVPGIEARPDFLVSNKEEEFYLEATCSEQVSSKYKAKNNIKSTVFDEINKIESDNFFLGVELKGEPTQQPSLKKARRELKAKLKSLNPDDYQYANIEDLPKWSYKFGEWELEFFPIPKKPEARGKKSRVLGACRTF